MDDNDTTQLINQIEDGDPTALAALLGRHRRRLRRMVDVHMDRRLRGRLDASDVVQEALADAYGKMSSYLQEKPIPFYPWLRQIAWNRLIDLHRRHLKAKKRSVTREARGAGRLPDHSVVSLAAQLLARGTSPSAHALRAELLERTRTALEALPDLDREVLVLRHLERMTPSEIAAVVGATEGAVRVRHLRALRRLRAALDAPESPA
jgi:RNA polymerase sigma-70 factor (ECF subfamily)